MTNYSQSEISQITEIKAMVHDIQTKLAESAKNAGTGEIRTHHAFFAMALIEFSSVKDAPQKWQTETAANYIGAMIYFVESSIEESKPGEGVRWTQELIARMAGIRAYERASEQTPPYPDAAPTDKPAN